MNRSHWKSFDNTVLQIRDRGIPFSGKVITAVLTTLSFALFVDSPAIASSDFDKIYSYNLYTEVSGSKTITADFENTISSANRLHLGAAWMDANTSVLGDGGSITLGLGSNPDKPFHFDNDWTYWRFPGKTPGNGLDVLVIKTGLTWKQKNSSFGLKPVAREMRFVGKSSETVVGILGLGYSGAYYFSDKWSVQIGGEEGRYYGNPTAIQVIFKTLRVTGGAPFVSNLYLSQQYVEMSYATAKSIVSLGYDNSRVIVSPSTFSQSLYVDVNRMLTRQWTLNTNFGVATSNSSDWYGAIGVSYMN